MTNTFVRRFAAFNAGDVPGMLACLPDDMAHRVNKGQIGRGNGKYSAACAHMTGCSREEPTEMVIFDAGVAPVRPPTSW